MIEVKMPKEIRNYETHFIGMFTFRQSVCLAVTIPVCIWIFNTFKEQSMDLACGLCVIPAVFAWLFGWLRIYGMRFEEFLAAAAVNTIIAPTKRRYETNNVYGCIYDEINKKKKTPLKKYRKSKYAMK